MQSINLTVLFR